LKICYVVILVNLNTDN